jgi:amino acid adenylation domain-containing protein
MRLPGSHSQPDLPALDPRPRIPNFSRLTTPEFLAYLRGHDVEVRGEDGKLLLNAPAGAITSELREELRRRKPELLLHLSEYDASNDERWAPVTFAQQRLWLIDRFSPKSPAYNIPQSWVIEGAVDSDALQRAIALLAERHPALRTRIEPRNGEPVQIVSRRVEIPLQVTDLAIDSTTQSKEMQLNEALVAEGRKLFALDQAPLIRFHLFRLAADLHLLSYQIHHIIADEWSLAVLRRDLIALYREISSGTPAQLTPLRMTYAEVAERERSDATIRLHESQLEYWRQRLLGMPTLLELPFSKSRPPQETSAGATLSLTLREDLTRQLRQLASGNGTSLYLLMLTIFAMLLYRYTGVEDFCLGSPITSRKRREEEDVIGLFINMLPLRCIVDSMESFNSLLKRTSGSVLADFEHSDLPFQKLVMELHPARSSSYSPLFQILFALNPKGPEPPEKQPEVFIGTAKFDLSLQIAEQPHTLEMYFEYRTDLFAHEDIQALSQHFVQLAESVVREPDTAVGSLALLTGEDYDALQRWNATAMAFDRSETLVTRFERQVRMHPDALALCCGETSFTFRQLHAQASALAIALHEKGIMRGDFVAICLDRSPELIASILAVLQAGAAYLPLDPKYPEERLRFMLQDSGTRLMIAERNELSAKLAAGDSGIKILFASGEFLKTNGTGTVEPGTPLQEGAPDDAAYLIYTSGSTGKPKGVVVEHKNAVALLTWAEKHFDPDSLRGVLASTSVCFDLSIFEIFLPLTTGNTVVLVNDLLELPTSSHRDKVTLVNTVPSAMSALLPAGLPSTVRTVCLAGEFLPSELVDRVYAAGVEQVFDLYGPTETTTYSTCALRMPGTPATIGTPITNTRIYVLDESMTPVPPGAIGELFIGGDGVTRGYLNRPDLTAKRFITLPSVEPEGRLYRTGDLARHRDDGALVYIGRRDQQVKLRGHRIELGEIESALRDVTGASDVAVVVQRREAGDLLAAFVVPTDLSEFNAKEYASELRKRLPGYMIPSRISPVAALPLTPNGKVDKKTLSQVTEENPSHESEAPRDLLEQWLANIWAVRLKRNNVPRNAHFFDDLGGHSLAAFEIFTEIENRTGVAMGLATLFQAPTVELLAMALRRKEWKDLRHIAFVSPGLAEKVIYVVGQQNVSPEETLPQAGVRVMALGSPNTTAETNEWIREISSFEAHRPAMVLVFQENAYDETQTLRTLLKQAGFDDVSLSLQHSLPARSTDGMI